MVKDIKIPEQVEISGIKINKEHRHDVQFNHTHKYDHSMEEDHLHRVEDEDVPKDYYTDD